MSKNRSSQDKVRRHIEKMSTKTHLRMYESFCSAHIINERSGCTEQAETNRKCMEGLLSFGKITTAQAAEVEAGLRERIPQIELFINELMASEKV